MNGLKHFKFASIAILVLMIGFLVGYYIYFNRPEPVTVEPVLVIPDIPYVEVEVDTVSIPVYTRGRVSAAAVHKISSSINGLVVKVSDALREGSIVNKGDILVELDEQPIILDIAQKQSHLDQVKLQLEETQANARVARRQAGRNASDYAKFIPQLRYANSQVEAAQAALDYAYKQLEDTKIRAPIDGKIINTFIDQGDLVQASSPIAVLYDMNQVEIRLPVNDKQMDIIGFYEQKPGENGPWFTPEVKIRSDQGEDEWLGYIVRKEGERSQNQLLYLVAQLGAGQLKNIIGKPLLPGTFIEAEIYGRERESIRIVPREVLQANDEIWLIDENNQLYSQSVAVIYRGRQYAYLDTLLPRGTRVVSSGFHRLAAGMKVNPMTDQIIASDGT